MNEAKNQDLYPYSPDADMQQLTGFFGLLMAIDQRQKGEGTKGGSSEGKQGRGHSNQAETGVGRVRQRRDRWATSSEFYRYS